MKKFTKVLLPFPIIVLLLSACTDSLEQGLPGSNDQTVTYHPKAWKHNPQHGYEYSTNPQYCKACHGEDLTGGSSGVSCVSCHHGWDPGGMEPGPNCFTPACHVESQSHTTHFDAHGKGPGILKDENGCRTCHEEIVMEIKDSACDTCHSPDGAFDGLDDPDIGAWPNWADGVYEADGTTLKAGKEQWCAGCHDDAPAFSKQGFIPAVIVDNLAGTFTGTWPPSSYAPGFYGTNYQFHAVGGVTDYFRWTPTISIPSEYEVSARWTTDPGRAPDATYTIHHDGGTIQKSVDQHFNGGVWVSLGTYSFDGIGDYVELNPSDNGEVIADAIKWDVGGTFAPNVIGDDSSYGFYVTGHNMDCLNCHDAGKLHIDGEHRTYEANVTDYSTSYRLKDIDGTPAMNIPRPLYPSATPPLDYWQDFALCFDCHNRFEVLGSNPYDVTNSNFWNNDASIKNSHSIHLGIYSNHFDSDWNGVADSSESCIACHNVHSSPSKAMIRGGELISTPGTTDKVPALNFSYLKGGVFSATATWDFSGISGSYNVYARWTSASTRASNAKYIVTYNSGLSSADFFEDQTANGGQWNQLGTSTYSFGSGDSVVLTIDGADGELCADAIGWDSDGVFGDDWDGDGILDPEIVVDNLSASYTPSEWPHSSFASGYHATDYQFHYKPGATPIVDPTATLEESLGGRMSYAGPGIGSNGVCKACHGAISYIRDPFLGPKVLTPRADPQQIPADQASSVVFSCTVVDPDNNLSTVTIDLSAIGGGSQSMVHQGGGLYTYQTTVPASDTGFLDFLITATDLDALSGENTATITVGDFVIVDNVDGTFTGSWPPSSFFPGFYGINYQFHAVGGVSDYFRWTPTISIPSEYEVSARWTTDPGRAPDATYTIHHDGGTIQKSVDQHFNGGVWVSLGTYSFDGIGDYVDLNPSDNGEVIADAIKWELEP